MRWKDRERGEGGRAGGESPIVASGAMRAAVFVLCACALVGEALANSPTPLERQFAGLRIAIREGENEKAKKLLEDGARIWGKLFTDKHGICESAGCTALNPPTNLFSSRLEPAHRRAVCSGRHAAANVWRGREL